MGITPTIIAGVGAAASAGNAIANLTSGGKQASADTKAANEQLQMYNQTRSDLSPFFTGGQGAFSALSNMLGAGTGAPNTQAMMQGLQNYPGYQWALQQGNQALDRSAASRGLLLSGGQLKDLTNYNQGQATSVFGDYLTRLGGLASLGENAAAQTGNTGANLAGNFGNATMAAGAANASGIAGAANNLFGNNGVLQNALQAYSASQYAPLPSGFTGVNVTPQVTTPSNADPWANFSMG